MSRTYGSGGNQDLWTLSFWLKRCKLATDTYVFGSGADANNTFDVEFNTSDQLRVWNYVGAFQTNLITTPLFRDPSAWYHIVVVYDSAQTVDADRVTVYSNGSEITDFGTATYPSQNGDSIVGSDTEIGFGRYISNGSNPADIYLAECNFINGSAQAVTAFGETNDDGIWVPKQYSGSYGTGGFFLDFEDSSDLGKDVSGSSNDMTTSGLAAADQMSDTPTNNHCTFNSINTSSSVALLDGNLVIDGNGGGAYYPVAGTQAMESGKWYIEFKQTSSVNVIYGVVTTDEAGSAAASVSGSPGSGDFSDGAGYNLNGNLTAGGSTTTSWGSTFTTDDIIAIAIDADTGKVWFAKNNTWQASGDPAAGTNEAATVTAPMTIFCSIWGTAGASGTMRSAEGDWSYSAPSGFNAINTANIAAPTITDPSAQFQAQLYTGDGVAIGSGGHAVTFTGNSAMQPDFVWIKNRDAADSHALYDSSRGVTEQLEIDNTGAETTETEGLTTFGVDGFTVGSLDQVNTDTEDFVAWNWKANGSTTSSNTDGTITSTVQANTTAGFSIVTYTGTGSNATVGHGLGAVPKFFMVTSSSNDTEDGFDAQHVTIGNTKYGDMAYGATWKTGGGTVWNDTSPTSSVFSIGTAGGVNESGYTYIAYLWVEVEGFSKISSYTGNGDADGTFVWCGFKPAFVMIKKDAVGGWVLKDTARSPDNEAHETFYADTAAANFGMGFDILSNGFKPRTTDSNINTSGGSYVFIAFAESPFGGEDLAPATAR
jgi:hypothetical protein